MYIAHNYHYPHVVFRLHSTANESKCDLAKIYRCKSVIIGIIGVGDGRCSCHSLTTCCLHSPCTTTETGWTCDSSQLVILSTGM